MLGFSTPGGGQPGLPGYGPGGPDAAAPFETGGAGGPSLSLDFTQAAGSDPRVVTVRAAGGATYFDPTGTLQLAAANVLRTDYGGSPAGVTNWVRNSAALGAVAGSPGTPPTNWTVSTATGMAASVVGSGTEGGIPYVDVRWFGVPTTSANDLRPEANTAIPAAPQESWALSAYLRVVGGSMANVGLSIDTAEQGGTALSGAQITPTTAALSSQRFVTLQPSVSAGTTAINMRLRVGVASMGIATDVTLRVGAPQIEAGGAANPWVSTSGSIATVGATPIGALIEEARTNGIRNPRCEGAVVGSPGTLPTNWSVTAGAGILSQVIGSGYEDGIPYVDISYSGTPGANHTPSIIFETNTGIAALTGQAWNSSFYCRLVGGSSANISACNILHTETDSGGAVVVSGTTAIGIPTGAPLAGQRASGQYATSGGATTAFYHAALQVSTLAGALNFTLRIGAPQSELGSFTTSPVLPAIGTPAATVRAADQVAAAVGAWFNPAAFSIVVDAIPEGTGGASVAGWAGLEDLTLNNRVTIRQQPLETWTVIESGGIASNLTVDMLALTTGVPFKYGITAAGVFAQAAGNGVVLAPLNPIVMPVGILSLQIGSDLNGSRTSNGWIRRVRVWPRALLAGELAVVTT